MDTEQSDSELHAGEGTHVNVLDLHREIYTSTRWGTPIYVACYCGIRRDHDFEEWLEHYGDAQARERYVAYHAAPDPDNAEHARHAEAARASAGARRSAASDRAAAPRWARWTPATRGSRPQ